MVKVSRRCRLHFHASFPPNATYRPAGTKQALANGPVGPCGGVTASGRGVMGFTATGDTLNPSAAYAPIDALAGAGAWNIVPGGTGAAPADGFTSYKSQVGNPPRTGWGDYGAAAVDGGSVWIANEYVAQSCDYTAWGGPFFTDGTGQPARYVWRSRPRTWRPYGARQLVHAGQQADSVAATATSANGGDRSSGRSPPVFPLCVWKVYLVSP
jgi:hypothetical protein